MATGMGTSYHHIKVREQHNHVPDTTKDVYRQVYWARYIDWSLTTPLLLLDLSLLAGLNGAHILMAVAADIIMILTGLFAAFGSDSNGSKWGWYVANRCSMSSKPANNASRYAIACIAYLVILWHLIVHGRHEASTKGSKVAGFYSSIAGFTILVWTAYPM
jgi:bacteriorhodopsin